MKSKVVAILASFALLLSVPLFAQTSEEELPANEPAQTEDQYAQDPVAEEQPAESMTAEDTESEVASDEFADEELPQTASPLALLVLLGGAGAATAAGLRIARRQ
ncbi:MAG TPA: hypothetical protein VGB99_00285 [Acidobacteriota bacterium]